MPLASDLRLNPERRSQRIFFGIAALLFIASTTATVAWCMSMSAMGEMPLPDGGAVSMGWMLMCGQTWPDAAASFLGMWVVMMMAMMVPSLAPMLWRYREAMSRTGGVPPGRLTALAGAGYFFVWALIGMIVFPIGVALVEAGMQIPALARVAPVASGVVALLAGALQFTAWKARHLACCRTTPELGLRLPVSMGAAWRHGMRLGLHCSCSSAGLTAILIVMGMMDLRVMAVVTAAITAERLAPAGERVAHISGIIAIAAGLLLIARVAGQLTQ